MPKNMWAGDLRLISRPDMLTSMISSTPRPGWDHRHDTVAGDYWVQPCNPGEAPFGPEDMTGSPKQKSYHEDAAVKRAIAAENFKNIRAGLRSGAGTGIITGMSASTTRPRPVRQPSKATDAQVRYVQDLLAKLGKDHPGVQTTRQNLNAGHKARGYISFDEAKAALNILIPLSKAQQAPQRPQEAPQAPRTSSAYSNVPDGSYAILVAGGEESDGEPVVRFYTVSTGREGTKWEGYRFVEAHKSDDRIPVRNREHRTAILEQIARDPREAAVRFGQETNHCCLCHRELTDAASREAGIGPICASKAGW